METSRKEKHRLRKQEKGRQQEAVSPIRDEGLETKNTPTQKQADQNRVQPAEVEPARGTDIAQQAIVGPAAEGTYQPLSKPPTVAQVVEQGFHTPGKLCQRAPEAFVN